MRLCSGGTRGYTLIELIVAMGIFMMITALSITLLGAASRQNARLVLSAELLENARIGMDVIIAHVREAEEIKLTTPRGTDSLSELITWVRKDDGLHDYKFTYDKNLVSGQASYHRINFGGNELASYIAGVTMKITDDILRITLTTEEDMDSKPVVLRASVDLRHKKVTY